MDWEEEEEEEEEEEDIPACGSAWQLLHYV